MNATSIATRLVGLVLVLAMLAPPLAASTRQAQAAPPATSGLSAPVTGDFTDILGGTGSVTGTFTVDRFASQDGDLVVVGALVATLTDSLGNVLGTVTQSVTLPLDAAGTCQVLDLTLGPLDLDLLGLQVHLDQVHLEITAQQGPGNLLGNLLCGVAGLLNGDASSNVIARLLNQLLGLLG